MGKNIFILIIVCGFVFFSLGLAGADEIQNLKEEIKALQSTIETLKVKVEALEKKQTGQSEEVAKIPELKKSVEELKAEKAKGWIGEGARVGGHLKFYLFDQSQGERNNNNQNNNISAGVSAFYLYLDKDLSDTVSISIQPDISVTAAATPSLGSDISRATTATTSASIYKAFITMLLANNMELRAGVIKPYFCEEYASEAWWDEQYHANKGLMDIEAWRDFGVELYRNFDFKNWSLPVYFYLLNGDGRYVDNNEGKSVLVHLAPEISNLKFMGSFGYGKWDAGNDYDSFRYASGIEYKYKKFTLRSEYLYNKYENTALTNSAGTITYGLADTEKKGYYIKGLYRFNPKWRAVFDYSDVELPYTTGTVLLKDTYQAVTLGLNYFVTDSSIIMGEVSGVDADRSDSSETLKYYRTTIGWRTTF